MGEYARHFTEAYLRAVRPRMARHDEGKALFVSGVRYGGRLAGRTVGQILEKAAKMSGVAKTIAPHTFRHSMATHMLRHIQAILCLASITSTELYAHVSLEDLKEVVRRAHPHGREDQ